LAATNITITLQDDQVRAVREFVAAGKASSVSAFVQHAAGIALFNAAGWQTMLRDALRKPEGRLPKRSAPGRMAFCARREAIGRKAIRSDRTDLRGKHRSEAGAVEDFRLLTRSILHLAFITSSTPEIASRTFSINSSTVSPCE
jgi:hypothetical protein